MEILMWGSVVVVMIVVVMYVYIFVVKDVQEYKKAKSEIFPFVESYRKKCTGVNRFVVTVSDLQNSFREYETKIINRVWLDLIKERVIEKDPLDDEWCIRKHGE